MEAVVHHCLGIHPAIWSLVAFHGTEPLLGMKEYSIGGSYGFLCFRCRAPVDLPGITLDIGLALRRNTATLAHGTVTTRRQQGHFSVMMICSPGNPEISKTRLSHSGHRILWLLDLGSCIHMNLLFNSYYRCPCCVTKRSIAKLRWIFKQIDNRTDTPVITYRPLQLRLNKTKSITRYIICQGEQSKKIKINLSVRIYIVFKLCYTCAANRRCAL